MKHTSTVRRHRLSRRQSTVIAISSFSLPFMVVTGNTWGIGIFTTLLIIAVGRYVLSKQSSTLAERKGQRAISQSARLPTQGKAINQKARLAAATRKPISAATATTQVAPKPVPKQVPILPSVPSLAPLSVPIPLGVAQGVASSRTQVPATTQATSRAALAPKGAQYVSQYEIPSRANQVFIGYDAYDEEVWVDADDWLSPAPSFQTPPSPRLRNAVKPMLQNRHYSAWQNSDDWDDDYDSDEDDLGYEYEAMTIKDLYEGDMINLGDALDDGYIPDDWYDDLDY